MADQNDPFVLQMFEGAPDADTIQKLGPLYGLMGEWATASGSGTGWNVIAVPGNDISLAPPMHLDFGFVLEVIPYYETLIFKPALAAQNRGPALIGAKNQYIGALVYEQSIFSDCDSKFCARRGFSKGGLIHRETGMLLNMSDSASTGLPIARMGEIPHGNSIMALGNSEQLHTNPLIPNIPAISTFPFKDDHSTIPLGYAETQYKKDIQFSGFDQLNPNAQLIKDSAGQTFSAIVHFHLDTETPAGGGILNIPFIQKNVNTTRMIADYWLETIAAQGSNPAQMQLQYSQQINLKFASSETFGKTIINWPHVTVNTLKG